MSIEKAISSVKTKNLSEMKTQFEKTLTLKAGEKLEERRVEISKSYLKSDEE
jgi:hypothetical protein